MDIWASQRGWHREAQAGQQKLLASIALSHSCSFISAHSPSDSISLAHLFPVLSFSRPRCAVPAPSAKLSHLFTLMPGQRCKTHSSLFLNFLNIEGCWSFTRLSSMTRMNWSALLIMGFCFESWSATLLTESHTCSWRLCELSSVLGFFLWCSR